MLAGRLNISAHIKFAWNVVVTTFASKQKYEEKMGKVDWELNFCHRTAEELLPRRLPTELLHAMARNIAMYKACTLEQGEANELVNGIALWIRRLADAQWASADIVGKMPFHDMVDDLEYFIHKEIVTRQINFPVYELSLSQLFVEDKWRLSQGHVTSD